jgi:phosphatidylserine/phosphatidylglycerophosphate/cardiolipin synthase-like enzyme
MSGFTSLQGGKQAMANTGVKGQVIDEQGAGLGELTIQVLDVDLLALEDQLGSIKTLATGEFSITYSPQAYGLLETKPDLIVRIFDPVGRLLYESDQYDNVAETMLDIGQIIIPADVVRGWRVTLRQGYPAASPPPPASDPYPLLSQNNLVRPLVDNEAAWLDLTQAVQTSTQFVHFTQLWFNLGRLFTVFNPPTPPLGSPTTGIRLEEALLERNRDQGVQVRILLNDVKLDPGLFDSVNSVKQYYDRQQEVAPHSVEVRGFPRPYNTPLHGKILIVDSKRAYIVGSPFIQGYYDAQTHQVDEPRRGIKSFFEHMDASPLHDLSASIEGPAVEDVNRTFLALWNHVGSAAAPVPHQPPATTNAAVQIVRTVPGNLLQSVPQGETGILEAYLRAFREAQDFVFLDNQYFTEPMIANALASALNDNPNLQVIMVLNPRVDIPFYNTMQPNLINGMLASLTPNARARIGLFTLWTHDSTSAPQRIVRIYTHAKTGVVDDRWATIGSANLDGVSLRLSQHVIPPITKRDRLEKRGIEFNALIFNGVDGLPTGPVPGDLRRILWAEYLGYSSPNHPDLHNRPTGGWLALWQNLAAAKLAGLQASPPTGHAARILQWRPEPEPAKHLLALGLTKANLKNLVVETSGRSFDFKTGRWE